MKGARSEGKRGKEVTGCEGVRGGGGGEGVRARGVME